MNLAKMVVLVPKVSQDLLEHQAIRVIVVNLVLQALKVL